MVEKELAEAKEALDKVSVEHFSLFGVVRLVYNELQVAQPEGTTKLVARAS